MISLNILVCFGLVLISTYLIIHEAKQGAQSHFCARLFTSGSPTHSLYVEVWCVM